VLQPMNQARPPLLATSEKPDRRNLDPAEVQRFQDIAREWWDAHGKFRPLHQLAPARLTFIRDELVQHFGITSGGLKPLKGLKVLDVGCGGGLVSEPLAYLGASVLGIDPGNENISAASAHSDGLGLPLSYRAAMVEDLVAEKALFDAVVCLEVVEHVPDVGSFIAACAALVRPGGLLILSTINRNLKSYALAIVGAEYVLGWVPRGTHQWDRFVTLEELSGHLASAGLERPRFKGLVYDPLQDRWSLSDDTDVNYLASTSRPQHDKA
jgi:2-polyprenyl-6-hydroxyphenyl methylase / 3-demethylubiquinone-9 3-methyltransferase